MVRRVFRYIEGRKMKNWRLSKLLEIMSAENKRLNVKNALDIQSIKMFRISQTGVAQSTHPNNVRYSSFILHIKVFASKFNSVMYNSSLKFHFTIFISGNIK